MTSWTVAAYALAAVLVTGIALCMWGVPLPLTDNLLLILDAQRTSLADGLRTAFLDRGVLRPFYWAHYKVLYELSEGRYYLAFQGVHVLLFAATVLLSVAALRVRSAAEWAGAATALLVLLGLHTFGNLLREQPILVVTCSALAFALAFAETPSRWRDGLAVVNLIVAMFIVEIGLLVWVVHAGAWLCGRRGVSRRALAALSAAFITYFALRFLVLRAGAPDMFPRDTGYGFSILGVDDLQRAFGTQPLVLYTYNVMASVGSVLFSEPRGGVFEFMSRFERGGLRPWMWISVMSSAATTAAIGWFLARSRWRGGVAAMPRAQALAIVAGLVIVANAVISYPYSRDVTMSPAGLGYALAAGVAVSALVERAALMRAPARAGLVALLVVVSSAWAVRTVGLTYSLRTTAFVLRNDWAGVDAWLRVVGRPQTDPRARALVRVLRQQALDFRVTNPVVAQPFAEAWLGTGAY